MLAMTAVDTGSAESAVTYETQQQGVPSLRSAIGQPARETCALLYAKGGQKKKNKCQVIGSPFRFRCIAWSTAIVTGKDSSVLISVCCTDVMSGVVLDDTFLGLMWLCLGVVGEGGRCALSTSSGKSSSWLSDSNWVSHTADASLRTDPAVRVICTLTAAPCRSAAVRLNSGYTPVKPKTSDYTQKCY